MRSYRCGRLDADSLALIRVSSRAGSLPQEFVSYTNFMNNRKTCGSEPAREETDSGTAVEITAITKGASEPQRLPIERRVPGGAMPGVLVWPFFAPFLYHG